MFVVYHPEGQSFVGAVQNLPVVKVDPATRVSETNKTGLESMNLEPDHSDPHFQNPALRQYQGVKHVNDGKVIVKAYEIMSTPVMTVEPDTSIEQAWELMRSQQVHYLPVLKEGGIKGIFSKSDLLNLVILNAEGDIDESRVEQVNEIMREQVVAVEPDTDIREVAQALTLYEIGALPIVTQEGDLLGIITLADLVKRLSKMPPVELYI